MGVTAMQLGAASMLSPLRSHAHSSDALSVSSVPPLKLSVGKRLSQFFKGDHKTKDSVAIPAVTTAPFSPTQRIESALPDVKAIPVSLDPHPSARSSAAATDARSSVHDATVTASVPVVQPQLNPTFLRLDIFSKNVDRPLLSTDLPEPRTRIKQTSYLFARVQASSLSASNASDDFQATPLDASQRAWMDQNDPIQQNHLRWLIDQLVKEFSEDTIKGPAAVAEIVLVGPVLDRETYRALLACFISKFEVTTPLDITLLQGLVQLVECASTGYLVDNDLVKIATVLYNELKITHNGTSDHPLYLTWALSRVLDVMVAGKVKDLNRDRDHQPMLQLLDGLTDSDNIYLQYQAAYAHQALQYTPDDETPLQALWRFTQVAAAGVSSVTSIFKLDSVGLLEDLQQIEAGLVEVAKTGMDVVETIREGAAGTVRASEKRFDFVKKRSWYLALQGTALFIRQGRLHDFNQVVYQAPCRHNVHFQWGICRQLGEIAVDPLWDARVRQQAIYFLRQLYRSNTDWKANADVKRWIRTILVQISELSDLHTSDRARALLEDLKKDGSTALPDSYPLSTRLPLPATYPLLTRVQEIPKVEYTLHTLRMRRLDEYKQAVYILPMAKPNLQAKDDDDENDGGDDLFPLMDKVRDFLAGDSQVMLILGDSGAGKSTFNRHLENKLWQGYKAGGRIPLFINLPALERPEKELVTEQLRTLDFSDALILELKQHRQFILICDGYDESQLTSNLHTTNLLNRSGQWNTKLLITCRTQFLGRDYQDSFAPQERGDGGHYNRPALDLFQQAAIVPFSEDQIEVYVEQYVQHEPRTWTKEDYMDRLTTIPSLLDMATNPFLLTLSLEVLPSV
ncbi:hypothetical protein BGX23_001392, partial [Mortierella sp. AD031]